MLVMGCSGDSKMTTADAVEGEMPGMVTRDVTMVISDSGVTRYRAVAPLWISYMFKADEEYQYFPEGIRLDRVDSTFTVGDTIFTSRGRIVADTAYNYEKKQQWHLIGNVRISNAVGEKFETEDLWWDMRQHKVYSDTLIHIERPDSTIIEGYGFKSNDDFTKYSLSRTSGIFHVQSNDSSQP